MYKDRMIDKLSGLPICDSYKKNHINVRENYSHQSSQLNDEGIKSTQLTLTDEEAEQLIQRGYDDMKEWILNYHHAAIQSVRFSSFRAMCENMDLDELLIFREEILNRPQNMIRVGGVCGAIASLRALQRAHGSQRRIFDGLEIVTI